MDSKEQILSKRPIPSDTIVSGTNLITFREFQGLFEQWRCGSITAYSIVYLKEDALNFNKDLLIKSLLVQVNMPGDITYMLREKGEYVFIDFGLEYNLELV